MSSVARNRSISIGIEDPPGRIYGRYNTVLMKRFRRWMFNGLAAVSLLLCVATAGMWVRSCQYVDELNIHRQGSPWWYYLASYPGHVFLQLTCDNGADNEEAWLEHNAYRLGPEGFPVGTGEIVQPNERTFMGFACYWDSIPESNARPLSIKLPYWTLCLTFIIVPAGRIGGGTINGRLAARRVRSGQCIRCGYDLRATPDRCPECGTVPDKPTKPST